MTETSDLPTRLDEVAAESHPPELAKLLRDAAEEIRRLKQVAASAEALCNDLQPLFNSIERLGTSIERIVDNAA